MTEARRHIPVLLEECLAALDLRPGSRVVDGTFGAGGYSERFLDAGARVIAIDRDPKAIAAGRALEKASTGRLTLVQGRYGDMADIARLLGYAELDGVALDIGVSSMQLDEAERGFSLRHDAPLDMRMESEGRSTATLLAEADEREIADILFHYGEERAARRIARAIVADRKATPFVSTRQLASLIERVAPARPGELTHPATRSFQALRIAVNDELGELLRGLAGAERLLRDGGRLAVVTFHSLEDRIVKQFLARRTGRGEAPSRRLPGEPEPSAPSFRTLAKLPITPGEDEIKRNSRARPAKLRFAERTGAIAFPVEAALEALTHAGRREAKA